ncbi:MAG: hypothetical protein IJX99_02030 [Clostridia bacterium]|nr:hypothetical protein [Clostridia bacterium]
MISNECRRDSNESVNKNKRYMQIREILKDGREMSAKEVAVEMYRRGYTDSNERNYSAPRLTELETIHRLVKIVRKKRCQYTGKSVSVYKLIDNKEKWEQIKLNMEA